MLSTIPCSVFLYLQFLARCHPYFIFTLVSHMEGCLVLPRMGYTWISTRISFARTLYIRSCASSISETTHARNGAWLVKWRRISRKLPDLTKSPSERYKLSVCIKGSCTTCIQAALYNFYGLSLPQLCARSFEEEEKETEEEDWAVFPFSVYNSSDGNLWVLLGT